MTDQDLIARLRKADEYEPLGHDGWEAADRIEEMMKERDEARHLQSCACNYDTPTDVCMGHHALFERLYAAKRVKLEAKLAKAVEALENLADCVDLGCFCSEMQMATAMDIARATLAEIKGESHDVN